MAITKTSGRQHGSTHRRVRAVAALALGLCASVGVAVGDALATDSGGCTAGKLPVIRNGSFENGVSPPTSDLRTLFATKTYFNRDISSWAVKPAYHNLLGSVDWNQRFQATDGQLTVDLDGECSPGAIRQEVKDLVVGRLYRISFDLAGNPEGPPTVKRLRINANGQSFLFTFDTTNKSPENMGWITKHITFKYSGANPHLTFTSRHPNNGASCYGAFIDNVKIRCID